VAGLQPGLTHLSLGLITGGDEKAEVTNEEEGKDPVAEALTFYPL